MKHNISTELTVETNDQVSHQEVVNTLWVELSKPIIIHENEKWNIDIELIKETSHHHIT